MMFDEGPLPREWRHYLAILGSARHRCEFLARHQAELFLLAGGTESVEFCSVGWQSDTRVVMILGPVR